MFSQLDPVIMQILAHAIEDDLKTAYQDLFSHRQCRGS